MDENKFREKHNEFISVLMNKYPLERDAIRYIFMQLRTEIANRTISNKQSIGKFMCIITPIIDHMNLIQKSKDDKIDKNKIKIFAAFTEMTINKFREMDRDTFVQRLLQKKLIMKESIATTLFHRMKTDSLYSGQLVYKFGAKYWYSNWDVNFNYNTENLFVKPRYINLKDEITSDDGELKFDIKRWNDEVSEAEGHKKSDACKKHCSITSKCLKQFRIEIDTSISVNHLIAVQLYCNATSEQAKFSESYWKTEMVFENDIDMKESENNNFIKRHSMYANWGRLLYEAVNVFGKQCSNAKIWHGIRDEVLFQCITCIKIYGPLSTSTSMEVARDNFASPSGIAIRLDGSRNFCFNCEWISAFKKEKEYLFIGGRHPFNICDVKLPNYCLSLKIYVQELHNIVSTDINMNNKQRLSKESAKTPTFFESVGKLIKHSEEIADRSATSLEKYVIENCILESEIIKGIKKENNTEIVDRFLLFTADEQYDSDAILQDLDIHVPNRKNCNIVQQIPDFEYRSTCRYIKNKIHAIEYFIKLYHYYSVRKKDIK
eukprot:78895_1